MIISYNFSWTTVTYENHIDKMIEGESRESSDAQGKGTGNNLLYRLTNHHLKKFYHHKLGMARKECLLISTVFESPDYLSNQDYASDVYFSLNYSCIQIIWRIFECYLVGRTDSFTAWDIYIPMYLSP